MTNQKLIILLTHWVNAATNELTRHAVNSLQKLTIKVVKNGSRIHCVCMVSGYSHTSAKPGKSPMSTVLSALIFPVLCMCHIDQRPESKELV